jgi:hypothetical protein
MRKAAVASSANHTVSQMAALAQTRLIGRPIVSL